MLCTLWYTPIDPHRADSGKVALEYEKWKDIKDTFAFAQKLMDEENVLCLPGECFFKSGFVRIGMPAILVVLGDLTHSYFTSGRYIKRGL